MYKLIRRISTSIFPRPDRPWDEDATSNAPQISRKRRLSSPEQEDSLSSAKKSKGVSSATEDAPPTDEPSTRLEAEDVKEVTKGVKEVELEDETHPGSSSEMAPDDAAAVPLPESPVLKVVEATEVMDESRDPDSLVLENKPASEETEVTETPEEKDAGEVVAANERTELAVKETEGDIESASTNHSISEENPAEDSATLVAKPNVDEQ